jgi:hypothetical protein
MKKLQNFLVMAAFCSVPLSSIAHDLKGYHNVIVHQQITAQAADASSATSSTIKKYVIKTLAIWPAHHKLTICFLGGSQTLRKRIIIVMKTEWPVGSLTGNVLTYDQTAFSNAPTCRSSNPKTVGADIRVGFLGGQNGGNWSYVGTESLAFVPSMNFEGYDKAPPANPQFAQVVAHEMGHALGLEHEHQSPVLKDCLWDYDWILTHYSWSSPKDMHYNLDKLQNTILANRLPEYQTSSYDPGSIMHYFFEASAFTDGFHDNCFIQQQASRPDAIDHAGITKMGQIALTLDPKRSLNAIVSMRPKSGGSKMSLQSTSTASNEFAAILQAKGELFRATIGNGGGSP